MGKITILEETTKNPITLIGKRAGVCWGANIEDKEKNYKRGLDCIKANHGRTLEFVDVHMIIDGYSAKTIREYMRHVGGGLTTLQASTRYIDYSKGSGFDYVIPNTIKGNIDALKDYKHLMYFINLQIAKFIKDYNVPVEDATMMLPIAYETKIVDKRNLRNLIDMSHQRMCTRAYWEYREMFNDICKALSEYSEEWNYLVGHCFKRKCEVFGYCPEKNGCGYMKKKENNNESN